MSKFIKITDSNDHVLVLNTDHIIAINESDDYTSGNTIIQVTEGKVQCSLTIDELLELIN